jgi:hypothetical protein
MNVAKPGNRATGADALLRSAIAEKCIVSFLLDGFRRIGEPHDYGVIDGVPRLFFYQTGGESRSGKPIGWRWALLPKISELEVLDRRFAGPRPAPSGRHVRWDELYATVSPRPVSGESSLESASRLPAPPKRAWAPGRRGKRPAAKDRRRP